MINYAFSGLSEGDEAKYAHPEVKNKALSILKEVIEDPMILNEIVNLPYFDHKHFNNDSFLIKCLSHPVALQALHESGWIEQTLKKWKESENLQYVKQITALLNEELIKGSTDFSETYAYVFNFSHFTLSDDLRNDSVLLKRFPFNLIVCIEDSRSHVIIQEYIQTCTVIDPSGMTITGNTENNYKFSHSFSLTKPNDKRSTNYEEGKGGLNDVYNIKVALM